jgi:dTDP-4-dehydrorhamnose reductase|tara:strand:+ start:4637 stop:5335 length:699 start_codon:yes stop_codon:yes gene_type:complete
MKILITGGSGLLGNEIKEHLKNIKNIEYYAPTSTECNIENLEVVTKTISDYNPNMIIHCAAIAKFKDVELNPKKALKTNIIGTCNITHVCIGTDIRLIYISSSHVFDGQKGNYKSTDQINPLTKYAKTKAAGEYTVLTHDNSLIVRTEFCGRDFPFNTAYIDKWSSKDYVDVLIPKLLDICLSDKKGTCHVGGPRKSFYDFALERNPSVKPGSVKEIISKSKVPILIDTSFA